MEIFSFHKAYTVNDLFQAGVKSQRAQDYLRRTKL